MTEANEPIWAGVTPWQPLTEIRARGEHEHPVKARTVVGSSRQTQDPPAASHTANPLLTGLPAVLMKILYDLMVYPYSSVTVRIKRLGMSARCFEQAKIEGCERGFILESAAGATTYLIPTPKTFEALRFPCSYDLNYIEHSYYRGLTEFLTAKDPANRSVHTEFKIGNSGATADVVTIGHDGLRRAYEVTLSTSNVLSNAAKYAETDFVQIVFLCRDYRLREAVKACCREGGLDSDLLAKLDYWQFSALLRRQRKLSLY
jgi:hypothetical protein